MKYYGTPIWADLEKKNKRKKMKRAKKLLRASGEDQSDEDDLSDEDDDDSDMEASTEFFQQTGNFLADSSRISSATSSLPKNILDIKVCTDANKEDPDKVSSYFCMNHKLLFLTNL